MSKIAKALTQAATEVVADRLQSVANATTGISEPSARTLAQEAVRTAVASPVVQNAIEAATPQPIAWWKSQAVVGNIVAIVLSGGTIVALFKTGTASAETLSVPVGTLLANGVALYGRITTTRPIAGTAAAERVADAAKVA